MEENKQQYDQFMDDNMMQYIGIQNDTDDQVRERGSASQSRYYTSDFCDFLSFWSLRNSAWNSDKIYPISLTVYASYLNNLKVHVLCVS